MQLLIKELIKLLETKIAEGLVLVEVDGEHREIDSIISSKLQLMIKVK